MKKLLFFAAMMLGLASCQTEPEGLDVNVGGAVDTTITVSLPETTRATNSAEGAFANVDLTGDATIRYILKIYQKVGDEYVASDDRQVEYSDEKSVVFPVRLVPNRDYRFVAWADYVEGEADVDYHYNTADLTNITLNNTWEAMDETRDAFTGVYCTVEEGSQFTSASSINIALIRPFAKLRVITTDMEQLNDLGIAPTTATVEYKVPHYNAFNAFAGEAIGDSKNRNIKHENFTIKAYGDNVDDESMVLFTDYFFANNDVVQFNLTVVDQNGAVIDNTIAFNTDINVKRNHLTTIKGDILTDGNNINVEVEDDFANEYIYIEGDYTLTEDMVIDRPLAVRAGAKAVINLNGYDIINNTKSETFGEGEGIIVYGELDIIGEGTVQGSTMAVWARGNAGAVVNIYGGTFLGCEEGFAKGGRSVVYASSDNVVNFYDGTVKALAADKTSYANKTEGVFAALNVADNHGMINVYGGSFYKQNPAAPGTEPAAWNAAHPNGFLGEGYVSVANGEWFDVIYDPYYYYTKVSDVAGLKAALEDNTVEKIYLAAGEYDMNDKIYYLTSKKELISDAAIKPVVKGKFVADTKDFTATNIKFGRNSQSDKMLDKKDYGTYVVDNYNAIITLNYAAGTFEECEFDGEDEIVAINYFQDAAGKILTVNNCTFTNTFIYSKVLCNITNNTFNIGTIPYGICVWPRPAGSTNSICYFVNNTLNSTYFPTENLAYCEVMLLSQSAPYANLEFNIQGNSGSKYLVGWTNSVAFKNDGSVTFADGSKTFNFPKLVD